MYFILGWQIFCFTIVMSSNFHWTISRGLTTVKRQVMFDLTVQFTVNWYKFSRTGFFGGFLFVLLVPLDLLMMLSADILVS